jgi:hypothetical protein
VTVAVDDKPVTVAGPVRCLEQKSGRAADESVLTRGHLDDVELGALARAESTWHRSAT